MVGDLAFMHRSVERAKTEMAVRNERTHTKLGGKLERVAAPGATWSAGTSF